MRGYAKLKELGKVGGLISRAEADWLVANKQAEFDTYKGDLVDMPSHLRLRAKAGYWIFVWQIDYNAKPNVRGSLPDPNSEAQRRPWESIGVSQATYYRHKASGVLMRMVKHGVSQTRENIEKWLVCEKQGIDIAAVFGPARTPLSSDTKAQTSSLSSDNDDTAARARERCGCEGVIGRAHVRGCEHDWTRHGASPETGKCGVEVV